MIKNIVIVYYSNLELIFEFTYNIQDLIYFYPLSRSIICKTFKNGWIDVKIEQKQKVKSIPTLNGW